MADTSELLPGDVFGIIDRLRSYAAHKGNRKNAPVSSKLMAEAADVIERLAAKSRLQAEALRKCPDCGGDGYAQEMVSSLKCETCNGSGKVSCTTSQAEAQAPTTAASVLTDGWQPISTIPDSNDLVWLARGDQVAGPVDPHAIVSAGFVMHDGFELWAPCEPPRLTSGAPAPAPTREQVDELATRVWHIANHQGPIEPGTDHERIVRVLNELLALRPSSAPTGETCPKCGGLHPGPKCLPPGLTNPPKRVYG